MKEKVTIIPEASALIDTDVPTLYGMIYKENSGKAWIVQSQSNSGILVFKKQTEDKFYHVHIAKCLCSKEYIIYIKMGPNEIWRTETYDIRKWNMPNKEAFTTTNQFIRLH